MLLFFYQEWTASKCVVEDTRFHHGGLICALGVTDVTLLASKIILCDVTVTKGTDSVTTFQEWRVGSRTV